MNHSRRQFMTHVAAGAAASLLWNGTVRGEDAAKAVRLSACDWSLQAGGPDGLEIAKAIGLNGLEVSAGAASDTLEVAKPETIAQYKARASETGVAISSVAMGFLNGSPLATEDRGVAWLEQTIGATKDLGAKVILVAFFGKGDLRRGKELKADAIDSVVGKLKEAAPKAEEAGVILGLENTLSAEQNLAIVDRIQSKAIQVYYDIGNSTDGDYDVPAEIRLLGARMCQVHFKDDGHYLGEGDVAMAPVAEALHAIDYGGWIVLETAIPSKDRDADFARNAAYVRKLMAPA